MRSARSTVSGGPPQSTTSGDSREISVAQRKGLHIKQPIGPSHLAILAFGSISQIALAEDFTPAMQVLGIEVGDTNALHLRMSGDTKCSSPLAVVGKAQPYYKDIA